MNLYERIDHEEDYHEMLSSSLNYYLLAVVGDKHVEFLYESLKQYLSEEKECSEIFHLFELFLETPFRSDEFLKLSLETFYSPYSDEGLREVIAAGYDHPEIRKAINSRLKFLAPYMKYLTKEEVDWAYGSEWSELGHVLFPNPESHLFNEDLNNDEDFIVAILGHSDERSSSMIFDRAKRVSGKDEDLVRFRDEREQNLKVEFIDPLPENSIQWMETVPDFIREQFVDFLGRIKRR